MTPVDPDNFVAEINVHVIAITPIRDAQIFHFVISPNSEAVSASPAVRKLLWFQFWKKILLQFWQDLYNFCNLKRFYSKTYIHIL